MTFSLTFWKFQKVEVSRNLNSTNVKSNSSVELSLHYRNTFGSWEELQKAMDIRLTSLLLPNFTHVFVARTEM